MLDYLPKAELAFRLNVRCAPPQTIGRVRGATAMMVPITGGTVTGDLLHGEVLAGGADWAVRGDDGVSSVDARYAIKAADGTIIQVFNTGSTLMDRSSAAPPARVLTTPRFIAPEGPHVWLNRTVFVGTLEFGKSPEPGAVLVTVFKIT